MNIGVRFLRLLSPTHEDQRMELRKAIACSQAHAEHITRTVEQNEVREAIRKIFQCSAD